MVDAAHLTRAKTISPVDRLELIGAVWGALSPADVPVPEEGKALRDVRLADLESNPQDQGPWSELQTRVERNCLDLCVGNGIRRRALRLLRPTRAGGADGVSLAGRLLVLVAGLALLGGCANQAVVQRKQAQLLAGTPRCHSPQECDMMWAVARHWVLGHSARKLQHITDDFLETYNPESYSPALAMRVEKIPLPDGTGHQFLITTWCNNLFGCSPDRLDAALAFNKAVSTVRAPERMPAPDNASPADLSPSGPLPASPLVDHGQ